MHQGPQQASSELWAVRGCLWKKLMEGTRFQFNGITRPQEMLISVSIYLTFLFTLQPLL